MRASIPQNSDTKIVMTVVIFGDVFRKRGAAEVKQNTGYLLKILTRSNTILIQNQKQVVACTRLEKLLLHIGKRTDSFDFNFWLSFYYTKCVLKEGGHKSTF